jgi:filamentous hemagglutinin family protein
MTPKFRYHYTTNLLASLCIWVIISNDFASCQGIIPDPTLGPNNTSMVNPSLSVSNSDVITGGARPEKGPNLFHSFKEFGVSEFHSVYFDSPDGIARIITRVTGDKRSEISGKLGVSGSNSANVDLFFINPNGIIFGPNSSLDLKGSFISTSANSLIFSDSTQYSSDGTASSTTLTISSPIGLKFRDKPGIISNKSQVTDDSGQTVGLKVESGKTLALVGGDITMEGGVLTAPNGHIELGSVSDFSQVDLKVIDKGWELEYQNLQDFSNITLFKGASISSEGEETSEIRLQGKTITISDASSIFGTRFLGSGTGKGGMIKITASDSFILGGSILVSDTVGAGDAGNIVIQSEKVFLRENALISTSSAGTYLNTGNIIATGNAGDVSIKAKEIEVGGGASIRTVTLGQGKGGNISFSADSVKILGANSLLVTSTQPLSIFASSFSSSSEAGNISIATESLQILDGGGVEANSFGNGDAGNINILSSSILLENQGFLVAQTVGGKGSINIYNSNNLILRENSFISTNATQNADGGNITINTSLLLALSPNGSEGSDIVAQADGGSGGNIIINAKGIFGIQEREARSGNQTNDIDASSQFGQSGQVQINTTTDPNQGLVELPTTVVDPTTLVAQNPCRRASSSEFTRSGRGGLPPSLSQDLNGEATQVGLVEPANLSARKPESKTPSKEFSSLPLSFSQIKPAQGWVYNDRGEVVLVAYNSAVTGPQRLQSSPKGCSVF